MRTLVSIAVGLGLAGCASELCSQWAVANGAADQKVLSCNGLSSLTDGGVPPCFVNAVCAAFESCSSADLVVLGNQADCANAFLASGSCDPQPFNDCLGDAGQTSATCNGAARNLPLACTSDGD
jgi:hypothetical protein